MLIEQGRAPMATSDGSAAQPRLPEQREAAESEQLVDWNKLSDEDRRRSELEQLTIDLAAGR
jgi:hypothetical protein